VAPVEVSIHTDRTLWLQDRSQRGAERKVTRDELIKAIRQKQQRNPEQAVVIAADKDVRYEAVLEVMDMLQQNQVKKVGLLAKPRGQ
jgi:biopolymer transport protein TolR